MTALEDKLNDDLADLERRRRSLFEKRKSLDYEMNWITDHMKLIEEALKELKKGRSK